jgi:hypothetical protein
MTKIHVIDICGRDRSRRKGAHICVPPDSNATTPARKIHNRNLNGLHSEIPQSRKFGKGWNVVSVSNATQRGQNFFHPHSPMGNLRVRHIQKPSMDTRKPPLATLHPQNQDTKNKTNDFRRNGYPTPRDIVLGHLETSREPEPTSALPLKANLNSPPSDVRGVPTSRLTISAARRRSSHRTNTRTRTGTAFRRRSGSR